MKNYVHVHENREKNPLFRRLYAAVVVVVGFRPNDFHPREFYLFSKCLLYLLPNELLGLLSRDSQVLSSFAHRLGMKEI